MYGPRPWLLARTSAISAGCAAYLEPYRLTPFCAILASCFAAGAASFYAYLIGPLLEAVLLEQPAKLVGFELASGDLPGSSPLDDGRHGRGEGGRAVPPERAGCRRWGNAWCATCARTSSRSLLLLPPSYFDSRHSGDLLSRFTSDVAQVEFAVTQALSSWVKDSLPGHRAADASAWLVDVRLFVLDLPGPPGHHPPDLAVRPLGEAQRHPHPGKSGTDERAGRRRRSRTSRCSAPIAARSAHWSSFDQEQGRYLEAMRRSLFVRGAFTPTLELMGMIGVALASVVRREGDRGGAGALRQAGLLPRGGAAHVPAAQGDLRDLRSGDAGRGGGRAAVRDHRTTPQSDSAGTAGPLTRALELRDVRFAGTVNATRSRAWTW